jgi:hypothetical protein
MTDTADKMVNAFRNLDETFGLENENQLPAVREPRQVIVAPVVEDRPVNTDDQDNDIAIARETYHRLMTKAEDALDDIMHLAKQSEHPRAFEVAGQMIDKVTSLADKLLDMHKKVKDIKKLDESPREAALNGGNGVGTTNIVFTGTPQQLLEAMTAKKELKDVTDV